MADSPRHHKNASDGGSIVDTPQANTPTDEQPSRAGEPGGDGRRDDRRGDMADAADPAETSERRRSRVGSAGGGYYPPLPPKHERPNS
jgi:hypothetical protein